MGKKSVLREAIKTLEQNKKTIDAADLIGLRSCTRTINQVLLDLLKNE